MNPIKSIAGKLRNTKLNRVRRIKYLARTKVGGSLPKKGVGGRRVFMSNRKEALKEASRQVSRESLGSVGSITRHPLATIPIGVGISSYVVGRQRPISRLIRRRKRKKINKSATPPHIQRLKNAARTSFNVGVDIGRPAAAGYIGYRIGRAVERKKHKRPVEYHRARRTRKSVYSGSGINQIAKIFSGEKDE